MTKKPIITVIFWCAGAVCVGAGTNAMVGVGVFFSVWAIAGFIETTRYGN